jgi:hypothetical protein
MPQTQTEMYRFSQKRAVVENICACHEYRYDQDIQIFGTAAFLDFAHRLCPREHDVSEIGSVSVSAGLGFGVFNKSDWQPS